MEFIHIAAVCPSFGLGANNQLLYRNKDDLKRFKDLTDGYTVVMGRKTFESLGNQELPNRLNLVVSRNSELGTDLAEIKHVLKAFEALGTPRVQKVFIIGGGEIYRQTMSWVDRIELTEFVDPPAQPADVFYPAIDKTLFELAKSVPLYQEDDPGKLVLRYNTYLRKR